jgi:DNA invertase Pin-like site-specific DNA recombinase
VRKRVSAPGTSVVNRAVNRRSNLALTHFWCSCSRCADETPQADQVLHAHTSDALAEFERELIRTRTGEGRERAKAGGDPRSQAKLTGHRRREAIARREAGEVLTDIARLYNVSHSTISRLI